jgi:hypothetical protein
MKKKHGSDRKQKLIKKEVLAFLKSNSLNRKLLHTSCLGENHGQKRPFVRQFLDQKRSQNGSGSATLHFTVFW